MNHSRIFRLCIYALGIFVVSGITILTAILLWKDSCAPQTVGGFCFVICSILLPSINTFADIVLILMPIPTILAAKLPHHEKIAIYGILAVGSGTIVAAIVRLVLTIVWVHSTDRLWCGAKLWITTQAEVNLAIICNCLLLLRPFARRHMTWLFRSRRLIEGKLERKRKGVASHSIGGHAISGWHEDLCQNSWSLHTLEKGSRIERAADGVLVEEEVEVVYQDTDHGSKVVP
ncbi:hypothetical protein BGZ63DRAFT_387227 [Mariannaea sp. PMI_226]|nr:hypothetical protein BGZ63DRAFT_387227 [Mariannaea sp. PMI_226]